MTARKGLQHAQRFQSEQKLAEDLAESRADIYVLNARELAEFWLTVQRQEGKSQSQIDSSFKQLTGLDPTTQILALGRDYGAAGNDLATMLVLGTDLKGGSRFFETYSMVTQNGRNYIIFKGNHRARLIVKGTRYLATKTLMIKMAVGTEGLKNSAKSGFLVSVIFSVTLHSIQWLFEDEYRWTHWLAGISTDLVKIAIASTAGYLAAAGIALFMGAAVVAVVPIVVGVAVSLLVGYTLNVIDKKFEITKSLIQWFEYQEKSLLDKVNAGIVYVTSSTVLYVKRSLYKTATDKINQLLRRRPQLWL
ncbi:MULTISPECIES: hypothetical protein [unclassified Arsukibacterium]|uniref:hypothetical protein n=1 Tax=unclassified Arsukibacterium TaxID=2635278 RepID=UPI000C5EFE21|nr:MULTISPECIES: hypothetical protein [unclassified Arsukibacterium]MAA94624.1 hypothetical protein [Rheinheimera sp.]MBM32792.1 hypothetical protein [Rheinheimera sp.]HAW93386.1 hypothetical protein [Candidatus Azambacteria bacterium]|tara:strand:+ start:788 stop:1705 length:918 start_codon:yes stop_codon:yes gene_type:complete